MKFLAKLEVKVLKAQFRIQGFELGLLQIIYLKWGTEFSTKNDYFSILTWTWVVFIMGCHNYPYWSIFYIFKLINIDVSKLFECH